MQPVDRIPQKKLANGFSMPVYGVGTWEMGGRMARDHHNDDEADVTALRTAIDRGVTHIDTAEIYAAGHSETLVGRAIKGYERESLFLVSKVSGDNQEPDTLRRSFEQSLQRLGTDYLDGYMLHRLSPTVPIDETMGALDELVDRGLVKHPMVSNFTVARIDRAQAASRHRIAAVQLHYSLRVREAEREGLVEYCASNDVMLIAWGPVEKGQLDFDTPLLQEMANKYEKTPAQIAINWLITQPAVVTIAKTRALKHLDDNLGALHWEIEPEDVERLRDHFPGQLDTSPRVPLDYS